MESLETGCGVSGALFEGVRCRSRSLVAAMDATDDCRRRECLYTSLQNATVCTGLVGVKGLCAGKTGKE